MGGPDKKKKKKKKQKVAAIDVPRGGVLGQFDRVKKRLHPDSLWDDVKYHRVFYKYSVPSVFIKNRLPFFTVICALLSVSLSNRNLEGEEWMIHTGYRWNPDTLDVSVEPGSTTTFGLTEYCEYNSTYKRCLPHHKSAHEKSTCFFQDHAAGCVQFNSNRGARKMPFCQAIAAMCNFRGEKALLFVKGQYFGCFLMVSVSFLLAFEITGWKPAHFRQRYIRRHHPELETKQQQLRANKDWEQFRKKKLMWLVGFSKVACIWTMVCAVFGAMLWGLVHFKFRQAFKCSPMDTSSKCPLYGADFKRMLGTMAINLLGSFCMLTVKKRFKRRHEDQIHKLRKQDFEDLEDEDELGNAITRKPKTRLELVEEFNVLEDQTEAAIMMQALARGYITRVRLGNAKASGATGYLGGAVWAGLGKVAGAGRRATKAGAKAIGFVPGGGHVVRGVGGVLGGVRGMLGGGLGMAAGGLGALGGGLGIIPKHKRRKRDPSRGGTVLPPPGARDVLFAVYPLDPFSSEELMQPGAQYGNVSHFPAEVEVGLRGTDVVVFGVHDDNGGGDGDPPPEQELLAEWPLSQVAAVTPHTDEADPEMMEMLELEIKHLGLFLFEADKAGPIAELISTRAAEYKAALPAAAAGAAGGGGGGGGGVGGMLGGMAAGVRKAGGGVKGAMTDVKQGVRLWV